MKPVPVGNHSSEVVAEKNGRIVSRYMILQENDCKALVVVLEKLNSAMNVLFGSKNLTDRVSKSTNSPFIT